MSYTIPKYVDTKEQAVLALASTIADEDKSALGDGSVNRALDVLADTLAGENVEVPQTNAGAILALAEYASGMVKPEGTIAITENGEGIDVSQYATADVSVSGGGDASTATVTYTLTGGKSDLYVEGASGMVTESGKISVPFFQTEETSGSFTVLLYGGKAQATFFESLVTVVSGDAEVEDGEVIITGDCTVTVAPN